jgi:glycerophosphoryl diester phosphodiesterase
VNPLIDRARRLVIAHRGASAHAPENTLPAFELALAQGADAFELDVHLSADGQVIVIHDDTLDRTCDRRGPVLVRSAAELAKMDAGYRFPAGRWSGRGAYVPRLAEVLDAWPEVPLLIEIKSGAVQEALAKLLKEMRATARSVVASMEHDAMSRFRLPPFTAGASGREVKRLYLARFLGRPRMVPYRLLSVPWRHRGLEVPTRRFIADAARLDAAVSVWTVDDAALARKLWQRGANGIVTNDPGAVARARSALEQA